MKRLNPVGSLLGVLLTILLFIGLGVSLWIGRGLAFSPGAVTGVSREGISIQGFTSHAEFEKRCSFCHEPLKMDLASKCMLCHTGIAQQVQTGEGVHSRITNQNDCATCHPEHRGRTFDPTMAAYKLFDHSTTMFSLNWHQENYDATPMQCDACHKDENFGVIYNQTCQECHASHDINFSQGHVKDFGENCLGCHDGIDRMQTFDHSLSGFLLEYKHAQLACTGCHTTENIADTPTECNNCHIEPTMHQGLFELTCATCHTAEGWSPAILENQSFSHLAEAGFSLALHQADYSNQAINCSTCHTTNLQNMDIQICIDCHSNNDQVFMAEHQDQFGSGCMECHDGVDRLSNFDHNTLFPLDGKHGSIQCSDCHADKVFRGTPKDCWQCHSEPDIHAGVFGLECGFCHTTDAWSPATLEKHDFPLNHGLSDPTTQLQCDACHVTSYIEYTCYNCHDHQPEETRQKHLEEGITEQELPSCAHCHPTGIVEKEIEG